MSVFVLDTSALLAFRAREAGADQVEKILRDAKKGRDRALISFVSVTEFYYLMWQRLGASEALKAFLQFKMLPLQIVPSSEDLCLKAGEFKAQHPISLADAFVAATALQEKATIVHKDPDFEVFDPVIRMEALPYKKN